MSILVCGNGDGALMTAIGNDYSFSELFARQAKAFCELVEPDLAKK